MKTDFPIYNFGYQNFSAKTEYFGDMERFAFFNMAKEIHHIAIRKSGFKLF